MSTDDTFIQRVREALIPYEPTERRMFGSISFMIHDKICVSVGKGRIMCRLTPDDYTAAIKQPDVTPMVHGGRVMKGFVFIPFSALENPVTLQAWLDKAIACNETLFGASAKKGAA